MIKTLEHRLTNLLAAQLQRNGHSASARGGAWSLADSPPRIYFLWTPCDPGLISFFKIVLTPLQQVCQFLGPENGPVFGSASINEARGGGPKSGTCFNAFL